MSKRETDDDYDYVIAMLNPKWRIIEDDAHIQWIVQEHMGGRWRSISFNTSMAGVARTAKSIPGAITLPDLPSRFQPRYGVPLPGEETIPPSSGPDRDEWKHQAAEWRRLKR